MSDDNRITRRKFVGSAALAAAATLPVYGQQQSETKSPREGPEERKTQRSPDHHLPNETDPGARNAPLEAENPDTVWGAETDSGTVPPFKYSFSLARKRIENGGWTRQVTARELPISKTIAGV
jgi:oxalate decarboxylase